MKKSRIFTILNKITPLVDIAVLFWLYDWFSKQEKSTFQCLLIAFFLGFTVYRWIKAFWKVWRSHVQANDYLSDNRVIPICGKQRSGKSSIACYFSKKAYGEVYSNIPLKLRGRFTQKLTTELLTCEERVEDYSLFLVDEASLFYNNVKSDTDNDTIYGQAVLCQCVGHFFDGNILYVSVDTDRIPKLIRDNYSCCLQILGQETYKYSIIGDYILKKVWKLLTKQKKVYTGLRIWRAQHYEFIRSEQYVGQLGDENNGFSPLLTFASFQTFGLDEYDDRYMRKFYDEQPSHIDDYWDSLLLDLDDFKNMYDGYVIEYMEKLRNKKKQSNTHFKP